MRIEIFLVFFVANAAAYTMSFSGNFPAKLSSMMSLRSGVSRTHFLRGSPVELKMAGKLFEKYGHLRGREVEPCDKTVERFYKLYGKPVPFVFRGATNELLFISHLDTVNVMFELDVVWTTGLFSTFDVFFQALNEKTRTELFNSIVGALKLDPTKVRQEAEQVLAWASGKTEDDVLAAFDGKDQSTVGQALARIKTNEDFLYTRNFGAGLIKLMQVVGVEPNAANAKRWSDAAGFTTRTSEATGVSMSKFEADVGNFLSLVEKMQQVMQLFADSEAREKKKTAERLAERAARAAADVANVE